MTFRIRSLTEPWQAQVCHDWGGDGPDGTGYGGGPTGGTGTGGIGRGDAGIGPGGGAAGTFGGFGFNGYMGMGLAQAMANIMGVNRNFNLGFTAPKITTPKVTVTQLPPAKPKVAPKVAPKVSTVAPTTVAPQTPQVSMMPAGYMPGLALAASPVAAPAYADPAQRYAAAAMQAQAMAASAPKAPTNTGYADPGLRATNSQYGVSRAPSAPNLGAPSSISGPSMGDAMPGLSAAERFGMDTSHGIGGMMSGSELAGAFNRGAGLSFGASPKGDFGSFAGPASPKGDFLGASVAKDQSRIGGPLGTGYAGQVPGSVVGSSIAYKNESAPFKGAPYNPTNRETSPTGYGGLPVAGNPADPGVAGVPGGLVARGTSIAQAMANNLANSPFGQANPGIASKLMAAAVTKGLNPAVSEALNTIARMNITNPSDYAKVMAAVQSFQRQNLGLSPTALAALQRLDDALGYKLGITANGAKATKGHVKNSQHYQGNAVDAITSGMTPQQKAQLIRDAYAAGFTGFGLYPNNTHLDVGPKRAWGPTYHSDSIPGWGRDALRGLGFGY